jgi:hypothetical protein
MPRRTAPQGETEDENEVKRMSWTWGQLGEKGTSHATALCQTVGQMAFLGAEALDVEDVGLATVDPVAALPDTALGALAPLLTP